MRVSKPKINNFSKRDLFLCEVHLVLLLIDSENTDHNLGTVDTTGHIVDIGMVVAPKALVKGDIVDTVNKNRIGNRSVVGLLHRDDTDLVEDHRFGIHSHHNQDKEEEVHDCKKH